MGKRIWGPQSLLAVSGSVNMRQNEEFFGCLEKTRFQELELHRPARDSP